MSTTRERLDQLKKEKGISGDSDLLRRMHPYLAREGKTKYTDVETFVKKTKGSFSQMIDGKNGRAFDQDFYLPLEIVLDTSMAYLLEGLGEQMPDNNAFDRGLKYAALTDTKGNYEKLIEEGVYLEEDEYQWTLLDYIIENRSKNGLEFFAERNMLPLDEVGRWDDSSSCTKIGINFHGDQDLFHALADLCPLSTFMKYFNGYYFVENGIDPESIEEELIMPILENGIKVFCMENIRHEITNFKKIPLNKVNPSVSNADGSPLGTSGFVNFMFSLMLEFAFSYVDYPKNIDDDVRAELLDRAYEINEEIMPMILALSYDKCRIGKYGFVHSDFVICGSIATLNLDFDPTGKFSPTVIEKIERLNAQIESFNEKTTPSNQPTIVGREMKMAKQNNPDFYAFYHVMKVAGCDLVAEYEEEKSDSRDCFLLPYGEKKTISQSETTNLYKQALKALSTIDSISESALGNGKVFHLPSISSHSFYVSDDHVTGIAPTEVVIGERYDNLAEFIASTCLSIPHFISAPNQVSAFATSLKEYGIKKKEVEPALEVFKSYYYRAMSKYDKTTERGKLLIANAHSRIVWLDLFLDDIKAQFK